MDVTYHWRGAFENEALNALHAEGFGHPVREFDWKGQVSRRSLGWVCAQVGDELVGFVNVAWDGGVHAFILDTLVQVGVRRQGIGTAMIAIAVSEARLAGCEWLHVDFDGEDLRAFYVDSCGFAPTDAGAMPL